MIECVSEADLEIQMLAVKYPYLLHPGFEYNFDEKVYEWIYNNSGIYSELLSPEGESFPVFTNGFGLFLGQVH